MEAPSLERERLDVVLRDTSCDISIRGWLDQMFWRSLPTLMISRIYTSMVFGTSTVRIRKCFKSRNSCNTLFSCSQGYCSQFLTVVFICVLLQCAAPRQCYPLPALLVATGASALPLVTILCDPCCTKPKHNEEFVPLW